MRCHTLKRARDPPKGANLMLSNQRKPAQSPADIHSDDVLLLSEHKRDIYENSERYASTRTKWRRKSAFFHAEDITYLRFLVPPGKRILDLGCGAGETLAALEPAYGVGVDFSPSLIDAA